MYKKLPIKFGPLLLAVPTVFGLQGCSLYNDLAQSKYGSNIICGTGALVTGGAIFAGCRYLVGANNAQCAAAALGVAFLDWMKCNMAIKEKIVHDYEETKESLNYDPSQGTIVKILAYAAEPKVVSPGGAVRINFEFALMSPNEADEIEVERTFTFPGHKEPQTETRTYNPGTWGVESKDMEYTIPLESPEGPQNFSIRIKVKANGLEAAKEACYTVSRANNIDLCKDVQKTTAEQDVNSLGRFTVGKTKSGVQARVSPKTSAKAIVKVKRDDVFSVVEQTKTGSTTWYKIKLNDGREAWLPAAIGKLEKSVH
jgi:hypothetical protein